ncbi:hypothetical protein [Paenibacillus sp.]|uniref:hypothetical protein n=1 Tax=Paenibacillus sp. TaxID=58172 RepID=UPI002D577B94|nr:hypothetical protein [Paenibacillus sp.]HZG88516.1 hypothetical protein [Paenibacillus sp.]
MRVADNERGAITLFSLLAATSLLLVSLLLIDLVRMRLAAVEAETEARRAGRSALARFETKLLNYGLFGASIDESRARTAEEAIGEANREERKLGGFRLYDERPSQGSPIAFEPLYHLGDHRVFEEQMLERMKYIAPIEYGITVVDKFIKSRPQIEQAQHYAKLSQEMQALLEKREAALDRAWASAQSLAGMAGTASPASALQQLLDAIHKSLDEAEKANLELRKKLNEPPPKPVQAPETPYPHVTIYPPDFFTGYRIGAATIASMHAAWHAMEEPAPAQQSSSPQEVEPDRKAEMLERLHAYKSEWLAGRRAQEAKREQEGKAIRRMELDQKQAAEGQLTKRRDNWKDACALTDLEAYVLLTGPEGLYEKYRTYNEHASSGGIEPSIRTDEAASFLNASFDFLSALSDIAEDMRDEAYMNEYALTHFTYRTYQKQKYVVRVVTNIGDRSSHKLQEQEAEYILYGLPSCHMNLAAAHTELFVLRAALRTMEAFFAPDNPGRAVSPMASLLAALAEGAKQANDDVDQLIAGDPVELPFVQGVTLDYKDHLRLFYLLHSRDASVLSRMQALIELNTGIDLTKRYTAVRVVTKPPAAGKIIPAAPKEKEVVVSY